MLRLIVFVFLTNVLFIDGIGQDTKTIQSLSASLINEDTYEKKQTINKQLKEAIQSFVNSDPDFNHTLLSIEKLSFLYPEDSSFRLINWNLAYTDGTYSYECGIQRKGATSITFLTQRKEIVPTNFLFNGQEEENQYTNATATKDDWIGSLYYDIIQTNGRFNTYYTLLGWDGNDLLTNKKVIDVLWFTKANEIRFGAPIFKSNTGIKSRIIFEFGGQNSMRLYSRDSKIIMDHLSPPPMNQNETTQLEGIYEYYGADLSFDALDWEDGHWVLKSDIDPDKGLKKSKKFFKVNDTIIKKKQPFYSPN